MLVHAYLKDSTPVEVAVLDLKDAGGDIIIDNASNNKGQKTIVFSIKEDLWDFSCRLDMNLYEELEVH